MRKLKYALIDAVSMEPTIFSPSEMDSIVLQDRQIASYAAPGLLVAVVVERNVVFALARMWEAFIEGIGWETKIFPSITEAQDWVRIRVKEKFHWIFLSSRRSGSRLAAAGTSVRRSHATARTLLNIIYIPTRRRLGIG